MSKRFRAEWVTKDSIDIVQLGDSEADLCVSLLPSQGNIAFEFLHKGSNWLWTPFQTPLQEMAGTNSLFGVPLLSPWANRLSSDIYSVNGLDYTLNRRINNLRVDQNFLAIHGLVLFASWTVTDLGADANGAYVRSTLNFTKHSDWMAHFPFAHRLELTHRIADGKLFIFLSVTNDSAESMPLSVGFHPYFKLPGGGCRDSWSIQCAGRERLLLSERNIPTGQTEIFNSRVCLALQDQPTIDSIYTNFDRENSHYAQFSLTDGKYTFTVGFGPKFPVAVIYAPFDKEFVCFEPMTAPTDAFHLAQAGLYDNLQYIAPGETWTEHFWMKPEVSDGI